MVIRYLNMSLVRNIVKKYKKKYLLLMTKKNKNNKNLNLNNISIIYKTEKQFWGISNHGNKKRIAKKKFESFFAHHFTNAFFDERLQSVSV